jgi:hypothetical protein
VEYVPLGKKSKRTLNSHWDVANPTFAPGNETAAVNLKFFAKLSFKKAEQKEL